VVSPVPLSLEAAGVHSLLSSPRINCIDKVVVFLPILLNVVALLIRIDISKWWALDIRIDHLNSGHWTSE
jgi:hypothetical protein